MYSFRLAERPRSKSRSPAFACAWGTGGSAFGVCTRRSQPYSGSGSVTVPEEAGSASGGVEDAGNGGVGGFGRSPRRDPGRVFPCVSGLAP